MHYAVYNLPYEVLVFIAKVRGVEILQTVFDRV